MEKKMQITSELLCGGLPDEFQNYMSMVQELSFEEKPNYDFYRLQFKILQKKCGFDVKNPIYDWVLMKKQLKEMREK